MMRLHAVQRYTKTKPAPQRYEGHFRAAQQTETDRAHSPDHSDQDTAAQPCACGLPSFWGRGGTREHCDSRPVFFNHLSSL